MSGLPDPKPTRRPRRARRIVDPAAGRRVLLRWPSCAACSFPARNAHHIVQKGAPHFGDDVEANLVPICGTGTRECHGAAHGSPYEVGVKRGNLIVVERRDAEWVGRRIGVHLLVHRPDVIEYVLAKLDDDPGRAFLERFYYLSPDAIAYRPPGARCGPE